MLGYKKSNNLLSEVNGVSFAFRIMLMTSEQTEIVNILGSPGTFPCHTTSINQFYGSYSNGYRGQVATKTG